MACSRKIYMDFCNCVAKRILLIILVVLCWTLTIAQNGCHRGFRRAAVDNATCIDINECIEGGHSQCGQLCTNTPGSYHCSCLPDYVLEADGWSCSALAPNPYILFSHGRDISKMDPGGVNMEPVLQGVGDVLAFDYHYKTRTLFWIDARQKAIGWAHLQGGEVQILISELKRPKQLAIDWMNHFIYWTDSKTRLIERVDLGGSNRQIIRNTESGRPNAIAVDPFEGYIFWSTTGKRERLERANLDGSNYQAIVSARLDDIVSITLDIVDKRVFWLDNGYSRIESADYDGGNREVVRGQLSDSLYGLSLFTDHVYWTGITRDTLSQANKYTGQDLTMLRTTYLDSHPKSVTVVHPLNNHQLHQQSVTVVHPLKQPPASPTASVNCSTKGDCPLVITRNPEPAEAKPFLVITNQHDIQRINFDGTDYVLIARGNMTNLVAMDFDIGNQMVYFADQGGRVIGRVGLDGGHREIVVGPHYIDVIEGLAIDWIRRRIYWTDSGRGTISTCQVDGGRVEIIAQRNLHQPKAIAVHPTLNLVYWSDIAEPAKIEAARHDGTHRVTVALNVTTPNSIAIDYLNNALMWLDSGRLTIETANLDGTYRSILTDRNLGRPHAVAEFSNHIWFTEWSENMLVQVEKTSGEKRVRLRGAFNNPSGIQVVHPKSKLIGSINPCLVFNGGCEQICLVAHVNQVICSCDAGYNLRQDGVSCDMDECYTGQAQCHPYATCLDRDDGYECYCGPGYVGDGYNYCWAPTTPKSQLIAAARVTLEPTTTVGSDKDQARVGQTAGRHFTSVINTATESGFQPGGTSMSKKTINTAVRGAYNYTPRRSTTAPPGRISTTRPPKGRRPGFGGRPGGSNNNKGTSAATSAAGVNNNNGGYGGMTNVGTPNNGKINTTNGANGKINNTNGGSDGKTNNGNTNSQNGNKPGVGVDGKIPGLGNLFPGLSGGPITDEPTDPSHFGICPNEYKYYCLNGGKCTWLTKLEKPSCRCLNGYGGERCLWLEPSYKSGINSATAAAISGGILLPIIIFLLIVAFVLYRRKKQSKAEKIRKASRPEIVLQPIASFSPDSQNNSASGSSFPASLTSSMSRSSGSRRSSICTALISSPLEGGEDTEPPVEPHATATLTRSDPTSPGSPSMMKAVLARLSDPGKSDNEAKMQLTGNHYMVPKSARNPVILPKPQFMLASGVAALARRQSQSESHVDNDDEEHMYSVANHYVEMNDQQQQKQQSKTSTFLTNTLSGTMPRRTQTHKYMAMDYNYPTASLGRRKIDTQVLYVNTPKKSSSASQVFNSHVQL